MRYALAGLDCPNCAAKIERELRKVEGLENVSVNFNTLSIELPEASVEQARSIINRVEPDVKLREIEPSKPEQPVQGKAAYNRLRVIVVAGLLFAIGLICHEPLHKTPFSWAEYAVLIPAYFLVGWPVIHKAFRKLATGQYFDENFLMTVATASAIAIHQVPEAVGVMLFFSVGEYLQDRAVDHSRSSIAALLDIQPEYANLQENGGIRQVRPQEVEPGQVIVVKPGEKVPLDGEVMAGTSFVDTSALTGESVPRKAETGDKILAGMINGQGLLTVMVAKPFKDSSVARILELVEKASEKKAPTERFITQFARCYTPVVVSAACLMAVIPPSLLPGATFSEWIYRALVLLVMAFSRRDSSMFMVSGRISTNTILAPRNTNALAVDTKVYDGMITSSPGCMSANKAAISRA